jgi:ribosome-associated protein
MESRKLAQLCRSLADDKKAEDIVVLDVHELSSVTDYFVVATGTSEPHLRAIASNISDTLAVDHGVRPAAVDGSPKANWVVLDYFDVIVHVMRKETREKFDLEGLWSDAARVPAPRKRAPRKPKQAAVDGPPAAQPASEAEGDGEDGATP